MCFSIENAVGNAPSILEVGHGLGTYDAYDRFPYYPLIVYRIRKGYEICFSNFSYDRIKYLKTLK